MKRIALTILFVLAATLNGHAGVAIQKQGRAQLTLPTDSTIALSDTIQAILRVEGSPALEFEEFGDTAGWTLVKRMPEQREKVAPNHEVRSVHCFYAPRFPDKEVKFTFPTVKFRDGGEVHTVTFKPVVFKVTTEIKNADLADLRDGTSIEPLPPIVPGDHRWILWSVLAVTGILILVAALVVRAWLRPRIRKTPAMLALEELRRLMALRLADVGKSERFVTLLTMLVRRFVERQYALPARRCTTAEFLRHAAQSASLKPEDAQFLSAFLARCDTIKFANVEMPAEECDRWAEEVRQFLEASISVEVARAKFGQSSEVAQDSEPK